MSGSSHDAYMKTVFGFDVMARAGAAGGGGGPRGKVKLSKPIVSTDEKQAAGKGAQIGQALKKGALSPEAKAELAHLLEFYEDQAFEHFVMQIELESGRAAAEFEGADATENPDGTTSRESTIIIPTAEASADQGGFTLGYAAQITEATTQSTSVTVYTVRQGAERGCLASLPMCITAGNAQSRIGID